MNQPTHVLEWSPAYLNEDGLADWELRTVAEYATCQPGDFPPVLNLPRGACPADLSAWVAGQLGHLVTLAADTHQLKGRHHVRWRTEPLFWVYPVVMSR